MFTKEELKKIDKSYFDVINADCHTVILQSQNTKHCWHIIHEVFRCFSTCQIHHAHKRDTPYHRHGSAPTLEIAMEKIKEHDEYQLMKNKKKRVRIESQRKAPAKRTPSVKHTNTLSFQENTQ